MDVVKAFNTELSALYEVKPPISKAKMTGITKSAIKGIKFYKHIVQSVEKFIQKCRPEYKVPGLYVVDSIVRQSRHQFGADKDVFGPRFTKNITSTFQHLFKCAEEDRSRIIRVLNLWQKNQVFPSDVIQPLLDMGHPNTSSESGPTNDESTTRWKGWSQGSEEPPPENRTYAEMSTKNLEKFTKAEMTNAIEEEASRSSMFKAHVKSEKISDENAVKFDANLLYFDYGDEEDEEETKNDCSQMTYDISDPHKTLAVSMAQKFLCDPDILRQLSSFSSEQAQQAIKTEVKAETEDPSYQSGARRSPTQPPLPPTAYQQPSLPMGIPPTEADKDERMLPQPPLPAKDLDERSLAAIMTPQRILPPISLASLQPIQADKDERMLPDPKAPPRDLDERSLAAILAPLDRGLLPQMPFPDASSGVQFPGGIVLPPQPPMGDPMRQDGDERVMFSMPGEPPLPPQDFDERTLAMPVEERSRKGRSRSRSNSRNRSSRSSRRRSRSRSPRRKRSRSPRNKNRSRSKERERLREKEREKEKERERKKKGIPPIKKDCVSICSTTIWIGHVPKSCSGADISNVFGEFGTVTSVDTIPPRGCAFIVMDRRQDGYKALKSLRNLKLSGSSVKMAWAPGKGVKGKEYKDYWEVDLGVSYIPYKKIPERAEALDNLEEGGWIDEESLSEKLKMIRKQPDKAFNPLGMIPDPTAVPFNAVQPPTMVPPPMMTPSSVNLPMLLHHPMQPQFGLHLPGLLPPQAMVMQVPMGIPPPNPMLMVQQQSQSLLGSQTLPLVGGVPPLVPRSVPLGNLQGIKNVPLAEQAVGSPMVPAPNTGDATPTEEDGTNVSSPSAQKSALASVQTSGISSQASQAVAQFTAMMAANRSMMSSLPPVSTSGTPIPFPPPNGGFNFPPPGMRPPGQMGPNSQFPFMSKPEGDGRAGMAPHMMNARLSFQEQHSGKEPPSMNNRDPDRQSSDMDVSRQGSSPIHPGKMQQEMVISTDDESSMDRDYSRIEVQSGPRFPSGNDFARMPMNMHRMRGSMGPMQGSRFPPMGSPFNSGMGGPRGPGMHPGMRMEMDFQGNSGPRPRMQMGPHGGRRGPDCEGRDWYPRDYDGPPFERERRYPDERGRDPWDGPNMDSRHGMRNHENDMRDDQPESTNRENRVDDHRDHAPPRKPARKSNSGKDLMADFHRLRHYQGDKKPLPHHSQDKSKDRAKADEDKNKNSSNDKRSDPPPKNNSDELNARKERDELSARKERDELSARKERDELSARKEREARKRSRWGRTLSEEREIQQKRRTEIEMKFQSYEQSAQAAGTLIPDSSDNPDVPLDGDIPPDESGNSVEPMDTGDTGITPVPILSAEAVNELISHPAITKLVSETIAPITSEISIGGPQLNESVPELTNDIPVSTSSSETAPDILSSSNHVNADLTPSPTPDKLPNSNVDMFGQESNEISEHSVSEPSKENQTSSIVDDHVWSNSTLSNSTIDIITVPETVNEISEINENSCDNTAKDMADISSVNKSPLVSTES